MIQKYEPTHETANQIWLTHSNSFVIWIVKMINKRNFYYHRNRIILVFNVRKYCISYIIIIMISHLIAKILITNKNVIKKYLKICYFYDSFLLVMIKFQTIQIVPYMRYFLNKLFFFYRQLKFDYYHPKIPM